MKPVDFNEKTVDLGAPRDWDAEKHGPCGSLPVFRDEKQFISCWRPTWRERFSLLFGRPLWLFVVAAGHPPVHLTIEKTVFKLND